MENEKIEVCEHGWSKHIRCLECEPLKPEEKMLAREYKPPPAPGAFGQPRSMAVWRDTLVVCFSNAVAWYSDNTEMWIKIYP